MRISGKLSYQEFVNVCLNKEITDVEEIRLRWENYKMAYYGMNDGRTAHEVGASIKEKDLED